ncbi:hypothetical protein KUTeg_003665 [Tegillarca granosa]|uniref:Uncharacterized protein n=1 Tax=Tegillarca granosa TaxID=220873 RepID=A0ABQ9FMQ8_TEGGR|nr:hypothetical protein KUTeg_003665 [Tegillarca granosa]
MKIPNVSINQNMNLKHYLSNTQNARCLVRTNEVAPIIIRDCREEFQHVSDFKEPIVFGSIADNMPEHPLIKVNTLYYTVQENY